MSDPYHLLLAEESETVSEMLSWYLGSAGFGVGTTTDGMAALRSAHHRVPDLVLMATRLPKLDGIQACRLLKTESATRDVPVILVTSEEAGAERVLAARAGADRCLPRDTSPEETLSAIRECLAGKPPRSARAVLPGGAVPDDLELLSRVNGVLGSALIDATLSNEISRVGREVDDFESSARALFRLIREIVPAEAMGAVFTDGVFSEGVSVYSDGSDEPLRAAIRAATERLRSKAGVPFVPDRVVWTGISGGYRGTEGVAAGALETIAFCTVRAGEMVKGLLAVYSATGASGSAAGALNDLLLRQAFMVLENAWLYRQIARVSVTDGLTGLTNVRHFREQIQREHSLARRHKDPYTILMMDIDHFKMVNDVYGHPVGDIVLREMASVIRETVRATDLPARYGGEEFIVFLPHTRLPEAAIVGERFRVAVERKVFAAPSPTIRCSVSVGVADYLPGAEEEETRVIGRADHALYAAKRGGRNRVVCDAAKEV